MISAAVLLLSVAVVIAPLGTVLDPGEQRPIGISAIVTGSTTGEEGMTSVREDSARAPVERLTAQQQLTDVLLERDELQKTARELRAQLKQALSDYEVAKQLAKGMQAELVTVLMDKDAAEQIIKDSRRQLAIERSARKATAGVNAVNKRNPCSFWW